jgi:hypothetical protein
MVYRLGMNGKVSSKAIHAALKNNQYRLVIENEAEGIFRMEVLVEKSIVFPSEVIPTNASNTTITNSVVEEEEILETANNVEAYDEF